MFFLFKILFLVTAIISGFVVFFMWDKTKDNPLMKEKLKSYWTPLLALLGFSILFFLIL